MSAGTRKAIYEKLDALMRKSGEGGFGYGDELQSGDEGYLHLMDAGVIADSTGKRIPGKKGQRDYDRASSIAGILEDGQPIYIYKKGEKYPRKVEFDPGTGALKVDPKPINEMPKPTAPEAPTLWQRYWGAMASMFGGGTETMRKWNAYQNEMAARENVQSARREERRVRNDADLSRNNGPTANNSARDAHESLITMMKNDLGYDREFNAQGNLNAMESLIREGNVLDVRGNPVGVSGKTADEVAESIGRRLYNMQQPLYIYKKGEDFPREVYLDRDGKLKISDKPINEMDNDVKEPSGWQKFTNRFPGYKNKAVFDKERSDIRKNLMEKLGDPKILARHQARNKLYAEQEAAEKQIRENAAAKTAEKTAPEQAAPKQTISEKDMKEAAWQIENVTSHIKKAAFSNTAEPSESEKKTVAAADLLNEVLQDRLKKDPAEMKPLAKAIYDGYWSVGKNGNNIGRELLEQILEAQKTMNGDQVREMLNDLIDKHTAEVNGKEYKPKEKTAPAAQSVKPAPVPPAPAKPMTVEEQLAALQKTVAELMETVKQQNETINKLMGNPEVKKEAPEELLKNPEKVALNANDKEAAARLKEQQVAKESQNPTAEKTESVNPNEQPNQKGGEEKKEEKSSEATAAEKEKQDGEKSKEGAENAKALEEKSLNEQQSQKESETEVKAAEEGLQKQTTGVVKGENARTDEEDAHFEKLLDRLNRKVYGGKGVPGTVYDNVNKLFSDAHKGEAALKKAVDDPGNLLFEGGSAVTAIAAYETFRDQLGKKEPNMDFFKALEGKGAAKTIQEVVRICPDVVYAADHLHNKQYYRENILDRGASKALGKKVSASFDAAIEKRTQMAENGETAPVMESTIRIGKQEAFQKSGSVEQIAKAMEASHAAPAASGAAMGL